eukprot:7379882-Prymnesium_polylepis.3
MAEDDDSRETLGHGESAEAERKLRSPTVVHTRRAQQADHLDQPKKPDNAEHLESHQDARGVGEGDDIKRDDGDEVDPEPPRTLEHRADDRVHEEALEDHVGEEYAVYQAVDEEEGVQRVHLGRLEESDLVRRHEGREQQRDGCEDIPLAEVRALAR